MSDGVGGCGPGTDPGRSMNTDGVGLVVGVGYAEGSQDSLEPPGSDECSIPRDEKEGGL